MKKLILTIIVLSLLTFVTKAQKYQDALLYGKKENRMKPLFVQHIPEKSLELLTMDSTAQIFINTADSSLWCWYKHKGFFKIQSGNATIPTLQQVITAGNVLTANNLIDLGTTSRLRIKGGKLYGAINFTAYDPANNDSSHITISGGYVTAIAMGVKRSNAGAYLNLSNNGFDFQTVSGVKTTTRTVFQQYNISAITDSTGFIMGKDSFLLTKSSSSTSFQNLDLFSYNNAAKFKWSPNGVVIRNGIGFYDNHSSAILDVYSKTKGVLLTRHTTAEMLAVPNPANGLVTYNTDSLAYCYFNGTAWKKIAGSESSMAISGNCGNIPILRNGRLVTTDSLRYVNERLESAGGFAWSKGGLFQNVTGEAGLYGDLDDALAVKVGNSFEYKYANGLLTTRNDTVTVNGVVSSSNGILSTHNDATGKFSLDWNTGQPFFYFQSNDTTTGNEAFLDIAAGGDVGLSITHSNVVGNAYISATNGEVGLTATNKTYINFVNGGGFEFVPGEAGYSKITGTDRSQIIGYYKNGHAPGIITLGDNVWTNTGFTGGLTIDAGSLTVSQGGITMPANKEINFDKGNDMYAKIFYDRDGSGGVGADIMTYSGGTGTDHVFFNVEDNIPLATINSTGLVLPIKNGTYGGYIGSGSMNYGEFGMYAGFNDGTIAAYSDITGRYNYGGNYNILSIKPEGDTTLLQSPLYIKPLDGSIGIINLWSSYLETYQSISAGDGEMYLNLDAGKQVIFDGAGFSQLAGGFLYRFSAQVTANRTQTVPDASGTFAIYNQATVSLNFPSTSAQTSSTLTMTVTGAAVGDAVILDVVNGGNYLYTAEVTASNTVTVKLHNYSSSAVDPAATNFTAFVIKK